MFDNHIEQKKEEIKGEECTGEIQGRNGNKRREMRAK